MNFPIRSAQAWALVTGCALGTGLVVAGCQKAPGPAPAPTSPAAPTPAPGPNAGPAAAAALPTAPTPVAALPAPATPSQPAAPVGSAQPAAAAGNQPPMSRYYWPLFVAGNSWTYKVSETSYDTGSEATKKSVATCTTGPSESLDGALVAELVCKPELPEEFARLDFAGWYGATADGLVFLGKTKPTQLKGPTVVDYPPREWQTTTGGGDEESDFAATSSAKFSFENVPGAGRVQTFCRVEDTGGPDNATHKVCFAAGIGPTEVSAEGGCAACGGTALKLVNATVAAMPAAGPLPAAPAAFAGKPPVASALAAGLAAGLKCLDAWPGLAAATLTTGPELLGGELDHLPARWTGVQGDVRPKLMTYAGKVPGSKCSLVVEAERGRVVRVGNNFTGKAISVDQMAGFGPPAERRTLAQGSGLDVFHYGDAVLVVYRPAAAKADNEWWLYDVRAWEAIRDDDAKIWEAFAYNDAAAELEKTKGADPVAVADGYHKATESLPRYAKAWLRECRVLAKAKVDSPRARRACAEALKSNFGDVKKQAATQLEHLP